MSEADSMTGTDGGRSGAVAASRRPRGRPPKSRELTLLQLREALAEVFGDTATIVAVEMVWSNTAVVVVQLTLPQPGGRVVQLRVPQVTVPARRTPIPMLAGDHVVEHWDPADYVEPDIAGSTRRQNREVAVYAAAAELRENLMRAVFDQSGVLQRQLENVD